MISVNLDDLIKDYENNLLTKLRGFGNKNKYVEYWVPGATKFDSLYNLINSFFEANQFDFVIRFEKKDNQLFSDIMSYNNKIGLLKHLEDKEHNCIKFKIDEDKFLKNFKKKIQIRNTPKNQNFNKVKKVKKPSVTKILNDDFRESILRMKVKSLKNNIKSVPENCNYYYFSFLDTKIHIYIDKNDYEIKNAFHELDKVSEENVVIDLFIDKIINKSVQEAAEHSVIYLEHYLRPKIIEEKVKGIILPHNGGRIFQELNNFLRTIYSKCKLELGFEDKINKEFTQISQKWMALDKSNKEKLISDVIKNFVSKELNIGENDIILNRIEIDFRIIVELSTALRKRQEDENILLKVEKIFQNKIDQRLELFTMEIKDQNKLRFKNSPQKNL